jgi:sugar fermentation stimulation protein A
VSLPDDAVHPLRLYDDWREASFIARPNRFTLVLKSGGRELRAFIPNTGRLEEYLVEGGVFYLTTSPTEKFTYRAVSTYYQDSHVLLDTWKINDLTEALIRGKKLPGCGDVVKIRRERPLKEIRPDFLLGEGNGKTRLLEVKTCTLCHRGVALFPDAPSARAARHIARLVDFAAQGRSASMVFIVPHGGARIFMPNFHTDREFAERFISTRNFTGDFSLRAYGLTMTDPVTVDLDSVRELAIDYGRARTNTTGSGSYVLVLANDRPRRIEVGRLGHLEFPKGWYAYVGSALGSLEARIGRHGKTAKKRFWHIDYVTPEPMPVVKAFLIRRKDRIETGLASRIRELCESAVEGFGASDSPEPSHLFYFRVPPHRLRRFMDVILDFRTFTEHQYQGKL